MNQASSYLRWAQGGYSHWCPGCGQMHMIPNSWNFDGNVNSPTFTPSVSITGKQTVADEQGKWTGDWVRDAHGNAVDYCCHYNLTAGQLQFHGDSTHSFAGKLVPLPELPIEFRDNQE